MSPLRIVPDFNVLKDRLSGLLACRITFGHTLSLECRKETFHHGIIVTVACATHADLNLVVGKQGLVIFARILAALIAMVDQLPRDCSMHRPIFKASSTNFLNGPFVRVPVDIKLYPTCISLSDPSRRENAMAPTESVKMSPG